MLLARWRAALAEEGRRGRPALLVAEAGNGSNGVDAAAPTTATQPPPRAITYGELDARSDALASTLRDVHGIRPRDRVGVDCVPSEPAEAAALLAVLKCQAIYVPLSRPHPWADRRARLLDAGARVLLTTTVAGEDWSSDEALCVLHLDPRTGAVLGVVGAVGNGADEAEGLEGAFNIVYTSGSTGPPKGVIGREAGALYRIDWMLTDPGVDFFSSPPSPAANDNDNDNDNVNAAAPVVVLRRTPLAFVDSVWEVWGALLAGVPLLLPPTGLTLDSDPLSFWATALDPAYGATHLTLTPTLLAALLATHQPHHLLRHSRLRRLICSGEPLPWALARRFLACAPAGAGVVALYGSTEVSGDATYYCIRGVDGRDEGEGDKEGDGDGASLVPLGAPIPGTRLWVRRQREAGGPSDGGEMVVGKAVEQGDVGTRVVEGELWVEGPGVALGYYRQEGATAASFAFPPDAPPRFRTGDWVRWEAESGELVFVGRRDGLVKVRGVRVGLEEAERRVAAALGLAAAAVEEAGEEGASEGRPLALAALEGGGGLLLALTAQAAATAGVGADGASVWRRLRGRVPPEMIPSRVCVVGPALPLTSSGKVDRRACLRGWGVEAGAVVQPESEQGDEVAMWLEGCFAALLGNDEGAAAAAAAAAAAGLGFFDRGGTSLLAMQALGRIEAELGVRLGVEDLGRDVPGLAARIVRAQQQGVDGGKRTGVEPADGAAAVEQQPLALSVAWRVDLGKCVDASPLLARVPGPDGEEGPWVAIAGSHSHMVAAADARTGRERWRTPVGGRVEGGAALSADGRRCLVGCYDGRLYALEVATGAVAFAVPTGGEIKGTPLSLSLGVGPVCVFGSYDGHAYVVSEEDGAVLARVALGGSPFASPVALPAWEEGDEGVRVVMATNRGRVLQLRLTIDPTAATPSASAVSVVEEWAREAGCAVFTTPAVIISSDTPTPRLVLGGTDGTLLALDPRAGGRELWRVDLGSGPVFCPPLPVGGADVVVGGQDGSVRRVAGATGAVVWVAAEGGEEEGKEVGITGRPALLGEGGVVVVATAAGCLRLFYVGTGEGVGAVRVGAGQRLGSPAVLGDGEEGGEMVVVGSRDDGVYGLSVGVQYGRDNCAKRLRLEHVT